MLTMEEKLDTEIFGIAKADNVKVTSIKDKIAVEKFLAYLPQAI